MNKAECLQCGGLQRLCYPGGDPENGPARHECRVCGFAPADTPPQISGELDSELIALNERLTKALRTARQRALTLLAREPEEHDANGMTKGALRHINAALDSLGYRP